MLSTQNLYPGGTRTFPELSVCAATKKRVSKARPNFWLAVVLAFVGMATFATAQAARTRDTLPPSVSIGSPATGSTVAGVVAIAVTATDNVGVARVDLLVNGVRTASDSTAPYTFNWDSTKVANGAVTLGATAYDAAGKSATASVAITVANTTTLDTQPPTVSVTSPSVGATLKGVVSVSANAVDNVAVARVDMLVNGTKVASSTTAPYTFSWDSTKVANGSVVISMAAFDARGNTSSASVSATIANTISDTTQPTVSITSPSAGSTLTGMVSVNASASDNIGVARVDLLVNGAKVASATASPYTFSWDSTKVADGSVILLASAFDAAGNTASASVNGTVSNTTAPPPSQPTLTVTSSNPSAGVSVRVYPADIAGNGDGIASLTRTYNANARVWLSAALRSGNNYFVKWQKDGVDYATASTTSLALDTNHTLTAVYATPSCVGIPVYPGTDSVNLAVAAAAPGSTFCIKAGIHRFTQTVTARAYDKFIGEPGAVLNGSKILSTFVREGSYWVATGQTQYEPPAAALTSTGWAVCTPTAPACIYREKVFVDGKDLWQVSSLAELGPGMFYFDYVNYKIYLFDDPTGHLVEATTGSGGLIGYTNSTNSFVTVRNLIFEKFGGGLVTASAHNALKAVDGWLVENNEFRLISYIAVFNAANNSVVRNNFIHHNGQYGVTGMGTFEGNVISYNNTDGWDTGNDAGASKFHGTIGATLRGNIVANNNSRGLWADTDNINLTYENNIIEDNLQMGILHEKSCAATIKNNVLRRNNSLYQGKPIWWGAQIFTSASPNIEILGNDVTAAYPGVNGIGVYNVFVNGVQKTYTGTNCGVLETRNVAVHDNVIRLDKGQQSGIAGGGAGYGAAYNLLFSNNTYYLKDLTTAYFMYDSGTPKTKELWQSSGQDLTDKFYQY